MNHTAIDRTPYTYLIIHNPTGKLYYGCRYAKGCHPDDLFQTYFTSSRVIQELITKDGVESFSYDIRRVFNSIDRCRSWEERVLRKFYQSENFLNLNCAGAIAPMSGSDNPMFGKTRPDAVQRMKDHNPMKNPEIAKKVSDSLKRKIAAGIITPRKLRQDECEVIIQRMKSNNPMSNPEYLDKMLQTMKDRYGGHPTAGSIWLANTITQTRKRINRDDLHLFPASEGWIQLSNKKPIPTYNLNIPL